MLLLDEITVDMDVVGRLDLLKFFTEECELRGATIIYATHIFDGLEKWITHVAYLADGQLKIGKTATTDVRGLTMHLAEGQMATLPVIRNLTMHLAVALDVRSLKQRLSSHPCVSAAVVFPYPSLQEEGLATTVKPVPVLLPGGCLGSALMWAAHLQAPQRARWLSCSRAESCLGWWKGGYAQTWKHPGGRKRPSRPCVGSSLELWSRAQRP